MRSSQSFHELSAWARSSHYSLSRYLDLNANALSTIIASVAAEKTGEDSDDVNEHGKRGTSTKQTSEKAPRKRLRSSTNVGSTSNHELPNEKYPGVSFNTNTKVGPSAWTSGSYSHEMTIQYTVRDMDKQLRGVGGATGAQWKERINELRDALMALCESEPTTLDLGPVAFGHTYCDQGVIALSHQGFHPALAPDVWLFRVPHLVIEADSRDLHEEAEDLIRSFRLLQRHGKILLDGALRMQIHPPEDDDVLPFSFHLTVNVSVVFPNIGIAATPISMFQSKKEMIPVEEAQRRVLRWAYLDDAVQSDEHEHGISIADFYGIMQPASSVTSPAADAFLQPTTLLPNLLPFQKRSLAWMLSREGVTLTEDGQLVQNPDYAGFSFWTEIEERNQKWYLHRLTEAFVDEPPSTPNRALGGILAEEPGLGKTLETIALILLNPAPPEWNPSVSRWDAESRLDIKAVKTSLIVTPPALAGQWKDELEAHAPSLKVLVYDGWTKVPVPMTKEKAEIERFEHKLKTTPSAKPKPKPKKKRTTKLKAKNGEGTSADASRDEEVAEDSPPNPEAIPTKDEKGNWLEWCEYVHQFDVVITTFPVLRSEVWVARAPPERLRREAAAGAYSSAGRLRSPLVMVEWKRVVMDEVQMVGGGQAAEMVSMIPRLSSFAVSGTPAKSQVADLIHVLRFLRVDDIIGTNRLWNRLLKPGYVREFTEFLQFYGIRTIKSNISDELTIPQQTRYLVPIEMGRVERHVYDQTLETILLDLGLDARGVAANDGWTVDGGLLRSSIRRLRGICTHPQVGQLQKRGDNLMKAGALKTMEAVLEAMADQNWRSVMDAWRNKILALVRFAQLQQQEDDDDGLRYQHMLETLLTTEKEMRQQVDEIQAALTLHDEKGKLLKQEAVKHLKAIQESAEGQGEGKEDTAATSGTTTDRKGKGKAKAIADDSEESGDEDEEEDPENLGLPKTPAGDEHRTKRGALSNRLRDAKVLLHRIIFLEGDAYHGLGRGKEEDEKYGEADAIRKDLLKITERNASGALSIVKSNAVRKGLKITRMLVPVPFLAGGGIKSYYLMEEMNSVIEEVLNAQSTLLWDWRDHIINLLSKPVSPGEGDADGQEYQRTLDDQGEAEAYLQAYSALFSDRRLALVNERALLAAHDIREKQTRKTMAAAAARAAAAEEEENHRLQNGITEDVELKPEHEVLHTNLSEKRKEILAKLKSRSVKSVMIDLQNAYANTYPDTNPERKIIADAVDRIRTLLHDQNELHSEVEMDLANLRKAFNQRIVYFRQLQEISDSVMDVDWDGTLQKAMQDCVLERAALETDLQRLKARQRYLGTLTSEKKDKEKDGDNQEDEDQTCVLCRCDFVRGFITHCAHIFCEECMRAWLVRREGKTCPVCRVGIDSRSVQRFTVNPSVAEPPPRPTLQNGEAAPKSHRKLEYNFIDPSVYADIQMMETYGDYGSKIQTLMRHLTYIKAREPGAKSIIFSAWADSLHIVEMALRHNKIPCLRIEQNSKHESAVHKFRTDPDILVLLLHGERENAGLNVICASRVFLLESVVQHSFEVQAIARIDRLGQTKPTEVYCYYAEDTIERNILDLAARKGLSLYTKGNAIGTLNISPFAREGDNKIDEPQKKGQQKGDFIHKVDDMLAILFPHMYEDLEHLLPADAMSVNGDVEMSDAFVEQPPVIPREPETNAVAGPSRF